MCVCCDVVSVILWTLDPLKDSAVKLEQSLKMDNHHKYEAELTRWNGTANENFYLWNFGVEAAFETRAIAPALCEENVHSAVDKQTRPIIIISLGSSHLKAI